MSRRYLTRALVLVLLCGTGQPSAEAADPERWFEDVGEALGVDFQHQRALEQRYWFPEIMSGGAAWLDYDGDGDLDLYLVQGGELDANVGERPRNRLLRNDGVTFVDTTEPSGTGDPGYGMGAAVGDFDGDGAVDLYVTNVGANVLYRNLGDGSFEEARAGVEDEGWGTSAAFLDYDRDGRLDLFLVNYVHWSPENEVECFSGGVRDYCHPDRYSAPARDRLFRNLGDGSFAEVGGESGIASAFGNGLGVAPIDFDRDGWTDLFVANDGTPNQLWMNRRDGRFEERALVQGCAVNMAGAAEAGMGVAVGDVDGDGTTDLLLTHLRQETNTLYLNRDGYCQDASGPSGLAAPSINRTGFGTALADFDHDGLLDLLVVNGRVGSGGERFVTDDPYAEPNQLFRGVGKGRFEELPVASVGRFDNSRAAALGDFDGDGAVDAAIVNNGGPARLLRNRSGRAGWVRVGFARGAGADVLGTDVRIEAGGEAQNRRLESAYSYCAANEASVHFGVATTGEIDEIQVQAPSGQTHRYRSMPIERVLVLGGSLLYNRRP